MATTVTANYNLSLGIFETKDLAEDHADNPIIHNRILSIGTMDGSTTPPVTTKFSDQRTLSGGSDSLDLTALPAPLSSTVDMTGLKVQLWKFKAAAANTADIVIKPAASNGYNLFGDADGQITLGPGCEAMMLRNDDLPDVAAGAKDLAITSDDADAIYDIQLVAG